MRRACAKVAEATGERARGVKLMHTTAHAQCGTHLACGAFPWEFVSRVDVLSSGLRFSCSGTTRCNESMRGGRYAHAAKLDRRTRSSRRREVAQEVADVPKALKKPVDVEEGTWRSPGVALEPAWDILRGGGTFAGRLQTPAARVGAGTSHRGRGLLQGLTEWRFWLQPLERTGEHPRPRNGHKNGLCKAVLEGPYVRQEWSFPRGKKGAGLASPPT